MRSRPQPGCARSASAEHRHRLAGNGEHAPRLTVACQKRFSTYTTSPARCVHSRTLPALRSAASELSPPSGRLWRPRPLCEQDADFVQKCAQEGLKVVHTLASEMEVVSVCDHVCARDEERVLLVALPKLKL